MKTPLSTLAGAAVLLVSSSISATATVTWLQADLDGTQAATASLGTGKGIISYDDATGQLSWNIAWKGLNGTPTDMHFHGPADPGVSAAVQLSIPFATNPAVSTATITPAQATDLLAGKWYVNLHTTTDGGGEIRGQVLPALTNYWPLEEGTGITAANSVAGGTAASLNGGTSWAIDGTRGNVLGFDGAAGTYADATRIGPVGVSQDFTWSFWSNADGLQPVNNDVILGNRFPNEGWCKFTPNAFEYRDIGATFNTNLNYPDFTTNAWVHNVVVKRGALFTYFRNGVALVNGIANGTMPALTPLYLGGDPAATGEGWQGLMDDVALWRSALPLASVRGLAGGTMTPLTAPLTDTLPVMVPLFSDDFSGDLAKWTATNRGLENNAAAGYDAPSVVGGAAVLGGTTTSQYWFGSSLESVQTFDSRLITEVSVKRVSLNGSGSAYRSSVWILGDNAHYLHLSQNVNEGGWSYNARDDGGLGTLGATGAGNNLALLDSLDGDSGEHAIMLRTRPGLAAGSVNVEMIVDGQLVATHGFTSFPDTFRVVLTGQARATNDFVSASFDDVTVRREFVQNLPPVFASPMVTGPAAGAGSAYSFSMASQASDPENGALTFSLLSGPAWATITAGGVIGGTPQVADTGVAALRVRVTDVGGETAEANVQLRVEGPAPTADLYGRWPLNDGSGTTVRNVSGPAEAGNLLNDQTGGLGANGEAWVVDPECGMVLSFNGDDGSGAFVTVGAPPATGSLPVFGLEGDFTLTCRVKSDQAPNNDIVIGNRYDASNADFTPRQFVKLTTSQFEWHWNGIGENADFADMPQATWVHHTVVKDGTALFYYRNGVLTDLRTVTGAPDMSLPLFFGGQGVENWRGYLSDVRLYSVALNQSQITGIAADKALPLPPGSLVVSSVSMDAQRRVDLTWNALPNSVYSVFASTDLNTWMQVTSGLTTTSYQVQPGGNPNTAAAARVYFQIRAFPAP